MIVGWRLEGAGADIYTIYCQQHKNSGRLFNVDSGTPFLKFCKTSTKYLHMDTFLKVYTPHLNKFER